MAYINIKIIKNTNWFLAGSFKIKEIPKAQLNLLMMKCFNWAFCILGIKNPLKPFTRRLKGAAGKYDFHSIH